MDETSIAQILQYLYIVDKKEAVCQGRCRLIVSGITLLCIIDENILE